MRAASGSRLRCGALVKECHFLIYARSDKRVLCRRWRRNPRQPKPSFFLSAGSTRSILQKIGHEALCALDERGNQIAKPDEYNIGTIPDLILKELLRLLASPIPDLACAPCRCARGFCRVSVQQPAPSGVKIQGRGTKRRTGEKILVYPLPKYCSGGVTGCSEPCERIDPGVEQDERLRIAVVLMQEFY